MRPTLAVPLDGSATAYHRIMQPFYHLFERGKPVQFLGDSDEQPGQYAWADILYIQCLYAPGAYQFYSEQKELGKKIICDFDDDYFNIPEDSPEQTEIIDHQTGEAHQFSPELRTLWVKLFLDMVDTLVVTTPELKELYQPFTKNDVRVIPNCVAPDMARDIPKKSHDAVRLLWSGSSSHLPDLNLIKEPLKILQDELGDKIEIFFQGPLVFDDIFPNLSFTALPAVPYGQYLNTIQDIDADIALMPIKNNAFNAGKSNLKYQQMSLLEMATVASNFGPYKCIESGVNGFLAANPNEWVSHIKTLVNDAELRRTMTDNAINYIKDNHMIADNLCMWESLLL